MRAQDFGNQLRDWRARRRLSQLGLALQANVSSRHLSFLESGRARPSRQMVLHLAECLEVPLRARNALLQSAGFAALYPETPLDDDALAPIRTAIGRMLDKHMPYPALVFDRYWNLRDANPAAAALFGAAGAQGPVNMLAGIVNNPQATARFDNWPEVAHHMMARLKLELEASGGDPKLAELVALLGSDPVFRQAPPREPAGRAMMCLRLRLDDGAILSLFSTIAQFGTSQDITVNDLRLELFFPADAESETVLEAMADGSGE